MAQRIISSLFILVLAAAGGAAAAEPLKIGVLLIEDSVPLYVAEKEGFFSEEGVRVELVPFLSALERDSALTAGAVDGGISDPVGAILLDQGRGLLKITSLCLGQTPAEGVFAILSAPSSPIRRVEDLKTVEIAVSNATIIEYVTDRLLEAEGFAPGEIKTVEVKKMPIRMQMLLAGSVQAATLPEPLASIAAARGAHPVISDAASPSSLSQTVLVFRTDFLKERGAEASAFFRALGKAVAAINAAPENYRPLFVETSRIPPFLAQTYPIPRYPPPAPFPRVLYEPVIDWLAGKGLTRRLEYETMVAAEVVAR